MKWWVYKCNNKGKAGGPYRGDWVRGFNWHSTENRWGSLRDVSELRLLKPGHRVIAHQSDIQEIVPPASSYLSSQVFHLG